MANARRRRGKSGNGGSGRALGRWTRSPPIPGNPLLGTQEILRVPSRSEFGAATYVDAKHRRYKLAKPTSNRRGPVGGPRVQLLHVATQVKRRKRDPRTQRLLMPMADGSMVPASGMALGTQVAESHRGLPQLPAIREELLLWNRSKQTLAGGYVTAVYTRRPRATTATIAVGGWWANDETNPVADPSPYASW